MSGWTEMERGEVMGAVKSVIPLFINNVKGLDVFDGDAEVVAERVNAHAIDIPLEQRPTERMELARIWAMRQVIIALRITADGIERMILADDTKGNPSG